MSELIDRDDHIEAQIDQIADVVEEHEDRIANVEGAVQNGNNGAQAAAPNGQPKVTEVAVTVRFLGQDEGQIPAVAGTTIRQVLAQMGGEYANATTAKMGGRVVPVDTPIQESTVVEPTPRSEKAG